MLAAFKVKAKNKSFYLLSCNNVINTVIILQHGPKSTYMSLLDSSGYNRGYSSSFIKAVLSSIKGLLICFSYPMKEPILGKSSENPQKNILSPFNLFKFYKSVFSALCGCKSANKDDFNEKENLKCLKIWSCFENEKSYPYKNIQEIDVFEDDPKSKMSREFENIEDFFHGLLFRTDFSYGGLLFLNCPNIVSLESKPLLDIIEELEVLDDEIIEEMLKNLRNLDFSTSEKALKSSKCFFKTFYIKLEHKELNLVNIKRKAEEDKIIKIMPRRKI